MADIADTSNGVDLSSPDIQECLREPIHLSGAIQPHGYLVSCSPGDWRVRHASANIDALLGLPAASLLGQSLREFVEDDVIDRINDAIAGSEPNAAAQRACTTNVGTTMTVCDVTAHVADGLVHVEFEPQPYRRQELPPTAVAQFMVAQADMGGEGEAFFQRAAEQVRSLTGYDRVMVYRFREDDSGEVIAETCAAGMEPYLGLRYPATDIPPQARVLYLRNRIRVIPDARYEPVPLVPGTRADGAPLDLSQHVLRSVSPVHLEYLANMGVVASMSISIISGGRLWGLIACHHPSPQPLSANVRASADLFGRFVSMWVSAREQELTMSRYENAQRLRDALAQRLAQARDFDAALVDEIEAMQRVIDCDGAALWVGGQWHAKGRTPDAAQAGALLDWLRAQDDAQHVAMTDAAEDWQAARGDADGLAGLLAINLGSADDWLFLFRVEQVEQVRWAGEPKKALVLTDDGQRIAPRKSFAIWRETVQGRSAPWSDSDKRGAERLHRVLREQRRRALAHAREMDELDRRYQRQRMLDQKSRLENLSTMLEGLIHLEDDDTAQLAARIDRLESDLRSMMHKAGSRAGTPAAQDGLRPTTEAG